MKEDLLRKYHFNPEEFSELQKKYREGELSLKTNLITYGNDWEVRLPHPDDTVNYPSRDGEKARLGQDIIRSGRLGIILMNGGAATRFQRPGESLPKGAFEIMEQDGRARSFMELKLAQARWAEQEYGGAIPVWILNSYFTDEKTRQILDHRDNFGKKDVYTYCQGIMKRVVASEEDIQAHYAKALKKATGKEKKELEEFIEYWAGYGRTHAGDVIEASHDQSRYNPPGHLDTTLWLILDPSRPLLKMVEMGVEHLLISNIDNLGATVDPVLPGLLQSRLEEGVGILCEVSIKPPGQKGGTLARVFAPEAGREWAQIIEEFAFPRDFDQDAIPDFNNATYTVSVSSLLALFELDRQFLAEGSRQELRDKVKAVTDRLPVYIAIKELKEVVGGKETKRPVVQFERLQGDMTRLLTPLAVKTRDRFFPVKKRDDIKLMVPRIRQALSGQLILD